ncbi:MAG: ATP-binding cassette domain-containing protein [Candidatus Heimdallarchaeaceae archaeon]
MINIESVTKIYPNPQNVRSTVALRGCDLIINQGDFVSIIGPSGAGKSTLMRLIGGLELPTSGKVNVLGQDIDLMNNKQRCEFRKNNIGFINQLPQFNLFPDLTVIRNLMVPNILSGVSFEEAKKIAIETLEELEIKNLSSKRTGFLSMGEAMRVSLCMALVRTPKMLLADEPTGQLDYHNSRILLDLLKKINEEYKTTIVVVSHDPVYFSVVSKSFLIFNGRLGGIFTKKDLIDLEKESPREEFISHIDSHSYIFLPSQVRTFLALKDKVKYVIDRSTNEVFIENPDSKVQVKSEKKISKLPETPIFLQERVDKSTSPIIETKDLTKYYQFPKELIFQSVNLRVYPRELIFLVGPSGVGKTTFLNIVSGIDLDFSGSVKVLGKNFCHSNLSNIEKLRSHSLYYSSQYINLYPSKTLTQNIVLFSSKKEFQRKRGIYDLEFLLNYLSLADIQHQPVETYSQGERKRASILLGLLSEPKLMLLDEPTANLDELNKRKVMKLIAEYVMSSNTTAIIVTHDLLSIVPNSTIIEFRDKNISKRKIITPEIYKKLKDSYLDKKIEKITNII